VRAPEVHGSTRPEEALAAAGDHLARRPVEHNVLLTLVHERIRRPEPGRYWWSVEDGEVAAFALQSPTTFSAALGPTDRRHAEALAEAIVRDAAALPGVVAEAATAAAFAGSWAALTHQAAVTVEGQRLYELTAVDPPAAVPGGLRPARADERAHLVPWAAAFAAETGRGAPAVSSEDEAPEAVEAAKAEADERAAGALVDRLIGDGRLWLWDTGEPVAMAAATVPQAGVSRIQYVYTPPAARGRGAASACVAALSAQLLAAGAERCILYTQLANPTANAVYRRLGYRAVGEIVSYRFDNPPQPTA
jgi:ribosomal protein S18 acetylase RimI-like enzyme